MQCAQTVTAGVRFFPLVNDGSTQQTLDDKIISLREKLLRGEKKSKSKRLRVFPPCHE